MIGMKILKVDGDTKRLVDELRTIRERKKIDEGREGEITTKLKDLAEQGEATLHFNRDIIAMIEERSSCRIYTKLLKAQFPEAAKACSVPSTCLMVKCC